MSVFRALRSAKGMRNDIRIVPADTWKQPAAAYLRPMDDDHISLNVLNEYCLLELFAFFDLPTLIDMCNLCERFRVIIDKRIFPKFSKIQFDFRRHTRAQLPTSIAAYREMLMHVGRHIEEATIYFDMYEEPANTTRIIDLFTKYVGDKLDRLELNRVPMTARAYQQFTPIFRRIKHLKWIFDESLDEEIDFVHICPNVRKLYFDLVMRFDINAAHWPALEEAYLNIYDFTSYESFPLFFQNNTQLKCLTMNANTYDYEELIEPICENLVNLERLTISYAVQGQAIEFESLIKLTKLKSFKVKFLALDDVNPNEFFRLFGRIKTLQQLALYFFRETHDDETPFAPRNCQFAVMADQLVDLRRIDLFGYPLSEGTLLKFIENATQLMEFSVIECGIVINEAIVQRVADIRKRQARRERRDVVPLAFYVRDPIVVNAMHASIVTVNLNRIRPIGDDE